MQAVLYLHGFLSSPLSVKAQQAKAYFAEHFPDTHFIVPEISNYPSELAAQLRNVLTQHPALLADGLKVMGSSMGGFLSTWLVEQYGGRAVLINPAVKPFELLQGYLGDHVNPYTNQAFTLVENDIALLRQLDKPVITNPSRYKVLLQTGDETLDYREAEQKYVGSQLVVEQGGDHSFVNFDQHLPAIAQFLGEK